MKPPLVPIASLVIALIALTYLYFGGDFLVGVLVFGVAVIGLRVGLSTHQRRLALRKVALEKYAQSQASGNPSGKDEFVANFIKSHERSETKKTMIGLLIAIAVLATWAYLSTH